MKTLKYILGIILGLLILIIFEGIATLGSAFQFERYNWFAYFVQGLLISATIIISILITNNQIE